MVYIDLLVITDLVFNYIILLAISYLLNRITKIKNIFLSSVIGVIDLIFLFSNINNLTLIIINFILSFIMSIIAFKYEDILYTIKNIIYMYLVAIFLGGGIYLINTNFFSNINSHIFNTIFLLLIAPIITYLYIKSIKMIHNDYSKYYKVDIYLDEEVISVNAFLDTGNKLTDPYKKRPIIIIDKHLIKKDNYKKIIVPYNTVNNHDIMECITPKKIYIDKIGERYKVLIGLVENINIEGSKCILNEKILERI